MRRMIGVVVLSLAVWLSLPTVCVSWENEEGQRTPPIVWGEGSE